MGRIIGIDLGTTNSVVTCIDKGEIRVLQNRENTYLTRSIVSFFKGEIIVGTPAEHYLLANPKNTVLSIKRLMGRAVSDPEVEKIKKWAIYDIIKPSEGTNDSLRVVLGGKEYSPIEISALILGKLKSDAEFVLGEEVTHAVITVPAYFNAKQKHATREAGLKAGLKVMRLIEEPTAAAIAFGIKQDEAKTVMVYDLGGGTLDITVLIMGGGTFAPLNLEGDMWLGGDNFDQCIVEYVKGQVKKQYGVDIPSSEHRLLATIKKEAQRAKEALGAARKADIVIPGMLKDQDGDFIDIDIEITRDKFEEMCRPLVMRTLELVDKAIAGAHSKIQDIDIVVMAGNATAMPIIQSEMEKKFGKEIISRNIHPKHCVAMGAVLLAAAYNQVKCEKCGSDNELGLDKCAECGSSLFGALQYKACPTCNFHNEPEASECASCGYVFINVTKPAPFDYGIQLAGDVLATFIKKGDQYETPVENRIPKQVTTRFPNQQIMSIPVYGGDNPVASENEKQGEAIAILPPNLPKETPIYLKLWLNNSGIFELSAQMENGEALYTTYSYGDSDIFELLIELESEIVNKDENFTPQKKKEIALRKKEIMDNLQQGDINEARKMVQNLKEDLNDDLISPPPLGFWQEVDNSQAFSSYVLAEFGWLISKEDKYEINVHKGELEVYKQRRDEINAKVSLRELDIIFNKYLGTADNPLPLGILLGLSNAIYREITPYDPVKAEQLMNDYQKVIIAFKNNELDCMEKLNNFVILLTKAINDIERPAGSEVTCWNCGKQVPVGIRYCPYCGADQWLPDPASKSGKHL